MSEMLNPRAARVQVWLAKMPLDSLDERGLAQLREDQYDWVGDLDVRGYSTVKLLNRAFERSQNAIYAWNPQRPCRSSRIGDVFVLREGDRVQAFAIMSVGFSPVRSFLSDGFDDAMQGEWASAAFA